MVEIVVNTSGDSKKKEKPKPAPAQVTKTVTKKVEAKKKSPSMVIISKKPVVKKTTVINKTTNIEAPKTEKKSEEKKPEKKKRRKTKKIADVKNFQDAKDYLKDQASYTVEKLQPIRVGFWETVTEYPLFFAGVGLVFIGTIVGVLCWYFLVYKKNKDKKKEEETEEIPTDDGGGGGVTTGGEGCDPGFTKYSDGQCAPCGTKVGNIPCPEQACDSGLEINEDGFCSTKDNNIVELIVLFSILGVALLAGLVFRGRRKRLAREKEGSELTKNDIKGDLLDIALKTKNGKPTPEAQSAQALITVLEALYKGNPTNQEKIEGLKVIRGFMDNELKKNKSVADPAQMAGLVASYNPPSGASFPSSKLDLQGALKSDGIQKIKALLPGLAQKGESIFIVDDARLVALLNQANDSLTYPLQPDDLNEVFEFYQRIRDVKRDPANLVEDQMFKREPIKSNLTFDDLVGDATLNKAKKKFSDPDFGGAKNGYYLLYGPPGTGKTALPEAVGSDGQTDVIQFSPADITPEQGKNAKQIEALFKRAFMTTQGKNPPKNKAVLIVDEVDKVIGNDQEVQGAFLSMMQLYQGKVTVVMTTNNYKGDNDGTGSPGVLPAIANRIPNANQIRLAELDEKGRTNLIKKGIADNAELFSESITQNLKDVTKRIAKKTGASARAITIGLKTLKEEAMEVRKSEGRDIRIDEQAILKAFDAEKAKENPFIRVKEGFVRAKTYVYKGVKTSVFDLFRGTFSDIYENLPKTKTREAGSLSEFRAEEK